MLIREVSLPDERDVVRTYKDVKTDAHQLCGGQEDVPVGAGDGLLKLLTPHLPVGGAEEARGPRLWQAAHRKRPPPKANPVALHPIACRLYPQRECQASLARADFYPVWIG